MAPLITPLTSSAAQSGAATAPALPAAPDKNMFLRLLVAQLRHQDPMKPTDGMQFVSELAQFQQLEQAVNTGQDITAIRGDLDLLAASLKS